jgi:hypothetical protein
MYPRSSNCRGKSLLAIGVLALDMVRCDVMQGVKCKAALRCAGAVHLQLVLT